MALTPEEWFRIGLGRIDDEDGAREAVAAFRRALAGNPCERYWAPLETRVFPRIAPVQVQDLCRELIRELPEFPAPRLYLGRRLLRSGRHLCLGDFFYRFRYFKFRQLHKTFQYENESEAVGRNDFDIVRANSHNVSTFRRVV